MLDLKMLLDLVNRLLQDGLTVTFVFDEQVATETVHPGCDRPYMKVMHFLDPFDGHELSDDFFHINRWRCSFHKNVDGLTDNTPGAAQDQQRNDDTDNRICNIPAEQEHKQTCQQGTD